MFPGAQGQGNLYPNPKMPKIWPTLFREGSEFTQKNNIEFLGPTRALWPTTVP